MFRNKDCLRYTKFEHNFEADVMYFHFIWILVNIQSEIFRDTDTRYWINHMKFDPWTWRIFVWRLLCRNSLLDVIVSPLPTLQF